MNAPQTLCLFGIVFSFTVLGILHPTLTSQTAFGQTSQTQPLDAQARFEKIKSLKGDWYLIGGNQLGQELEANPDEPFVRYEISAGGHCVIEKLFVGQPKEMTTIYYMDNGKLAMAHYCSLGNQPHMVAEEGSDPNIFFRLTKVGNMTDPNDLHISSHSLVFNQDELTALWGATKDQKAASTSEFRVKRK